MRFNQTREATRPNEVPFGGDRGQSVSRAPALGGRTEVVSSSNDISWNANTNVLGQIK